jgi:plastocyanin
MRTSILVSVFSAMVMMVYSTSVQAKEYTIKMISKGAKEAYYYDPKKITIKSGDTVTWINTQDEVHNVMTISGLFSLNQDL